MYHIHDIEAYEYLLFVQMSVFAFRMSGDTNFWNGIILEAMKLDKADFLEIGYKVEVSKSGATPSSCFPCSSRGKQKSSRYDSPYSIFVIKAEMMNPRYCQMRKMKHMTTTMRKCKRNKWRLLLRYRPSIVVC